MISQIRGMHPPSLLLYGEAMKDMAGHSWFKAEMAHKAFVSFSEVQRTVVPRTTFCILQKYLLGGNTKFKSSQ